LHHKLRREEQTVAFPHGDSFLALTLALTLPREHMDPAGSYNLPPRRISLNKSLNDILYHNFTELYDKGGVGGPEPPVIASIPFEPWKRSYVYYYCILLYRYWLIIPK
jgi:hypothetical protein